MVLTVIDRKFVLDTIQRKSSFGDSVGETSNRGAKTRVRFEVVIDIVKAENDVGKLTTSIRHFDRCNGSTEVNDLYFHAAPILKCVKDRKSTRLNSSHSQISYAVFCLKKKK